MVVVVKTFRLYTPMSTTC